MSPDETFALEPPSNEYSIPLIAIKKSCSCILLFKQYLFSKYKIILSIFDDSSSNFKFELPISFLMLPCKLISIKFTL